MESSLWTFSSKLKAEELDKRLRLNVGSILCKSFARIKEGTPMPDIIKQIVDEEIELPGYSLQVSIQYSYMFLRNFGPVQKIHTKLKVFL